MLDCLFFRDSGGKEDGGICGVLVVLVKDSKSPVTMAAPSSR
jgi:hypothetical protein